MLTNTVSDYVQTALTAHNDAGSGAAQPRWLITRYGFARIQLPVNKQRIDEEGCGIVFAALIFG